MDKLIEFLKKEVPGHADDVIKSLEQTIENIAATSALLSGNSHKLSNEGKFKEAMVYLESCDKLKSIEDYLQAILQGNTISSETIVTTQATDDSIDTVEIDDTDSIDEEQDEPKDKVDYKQYLVNKTIPYSLNDTLEHTTPYAFSFLGKTYQVDSYKDMWLKFCEILYYKDKNLFNDIAINHKIGGKRKAFIVPKNDSIARRINKPVDFLDTDIVIEINTNTTQKRKSMLKMLSLYRLSESNIKVYLESDRRPKHSMKAIGQYLIETDENSKKKQDNLIVIESHNSDEPKIGKYAKDYFERYFADTTKQYDISNFLNKYWCIEHLGIRYPLLKEVDTTRPITEQKNYNNDYGRYWTKPVLMINGKHYILCSQWFREFREPLNKWISEQVTIIPEPAVREVVKTDCEEYDNKKEKCMCTDAPTFLLPCDHPKGCQYFKSSKFEQLRLFNEPVEKIYTLKVLDKDSLKRCLKCGKKTQRDMIYATYRKEQGDIRHQININRCVDCGEMYIHDGFYRSYTINKKMDKLNVQFEL